MMPAQLKETTMDPAKRLMGTKAEARFAFISARRSSPATSCWTFYFTGRGVLPAILGSFGLKSPQFARLPGNSSTFVFR
jgi:hypothetical protein